MSAYITKESPIYTAFPVDALNIFVSFPFFVLKGRKWSLENITDKEDNIPFMRPIVLPSSSCEPCSWWYMKDILAALRRRYSAFIKFQRRYQFLPSLSLRCTFIKCTLWWKEMDLEEKEEMMSSIRPNWIRSCFSFCLVMGDIADIIY